MSSQTSDKELESIVRKCSSVKLSIELARAQSALDSEAIDLLTRAQLVSYICHLRRLAGQNEPVRDIVQDFDITKVIFLPDVESTVKPRTPTAATAPGFEVLTILQNMQTGQDRREVEDRRIAAERAEAELKLAADALEKKEQRAAKKLELQEKKEQRAAKKLERQEKKEAKERKRTAKTLKKQQKRDAKERKRRDDMHAANIARLDKIEADRLAHELKVEADRLAHG